LISFFLENIDDELGKIREIKGQKFEIG
jgi:hypothetical protein